MWWERSKKLGNSVHEAPHKGIWGGKVYIALPLKVEWLLSGFEPMTSDGK